jgi:hypothetical protein
MNQPEFHYVAFVTVKDRAILVHKAQWAILNPLFHPEDHSPKSFMAQAVFEALGSEFGTNSEKLPADGDYRLTASGDFAHSAAEEEMIVTVQIRNAGMEIADKGVMHLYEPDRWARPVFVRVLYEPQPAAATDLVADPVAPDQPNPVEFSKLPHVAGLRPVSELLPHAPWFSCIDAVVKGFTMVETPFAMVKYLHALMMVRGSEHYDQAPDHFKERWVEDVKGIDHLVGNGAFHDWFYNSESYRVARAMCSALVTQCQRERGHFHMTSGTMLEIWNPALEMGKAYLDKATPLKGK